MKTLRDLLKPEEIQATKVPDSALISGIVQDSKAALANSLFIAIRGTKIDSHAFVEMLSALPAYCVVDRKEIFEKVPHTILVNSTRELLGKIASRYYDEPTRCFPLVGITGTNGKTTSSFLLDQIWRQRGLRTGLIGTVETRVADEILISELTTPGALELQGIFYRMARKKVTVAAMEVSSIALEQSRVNGTHFQVGVFTNFTQDHLDYHGSMENYLRAKLKLFNEYHLQSMVVNLDDSVAARVLAEGRASEKITFSLENSQAQFYATEVRFEKARTSALIHTPQGVHALTTPLIGSHNLLNCIGVLATVFALKQDLTEAVICLKSAPGAPGRLERVMTGDNYPHIFVDYAHSDDALANVLSALSKLKAQGSGKLITVFGCGGDRDKTKRPKMAAVASQFSDITVATSDNPRTEDPNQILDDIERGLLKEHTVYHREVQRKKAIQWALSQAQPEDIVLVAGKGHETYQILGTTKVDFDDRKVIREYYQ